MKILAIADTEERSLGEHFNPDRWRDVRLIISCGDLDPEYLDYLVSRLNVPCLFVRGNHDTVYRERPPGGCLDLDGKVVRFGSLRVAGIEGSRWYGGKGIELGDTAMAWKVRLLRARILFAGGVDIVVAHSPPTFLQAEGDVAPDPVHAGFASFRELILVHQPRLFLHGHTHLGYGRGKRETTVGHTRVIDCYGAYEIDLGATR